VTPSLSGYNFAPATRSYNAVQANQAAQDFVGATVGASGIYYIVPDHLNTPRLVADSAGTAVWRWDQGEPFGNDVPNNNPSGLGAFEFNLRFPGQYFDRETNLAYNNYRDYDSETSRYVQSDLIGLRGGLNTYAYVGNKPIRYSDPSGLWSPWIHKRMTEDGLERAKCTKLEPALPLKTADVDIGSQGSADSFKHSMCDGNENPFDKDQQWNNYEGWIARLRTSCNPDDLASLLHASQDKYSPGHRDFKCWRGPGIGAIGHWLADAFPSGSAWESSVNATSQEISSFKNRCPCACN